jgi:hypothetical protein
MAPAYSPDGRHLAYFSNFKGVENEGIWVANADGSNAIELVQDRAVNVFPRWTSDSQYLIYQAELDRDEYRYVPISGGAPTTLMSTSATDEWFDVGPDDRLLFLRDDGTIHSFDTEAKKDVLLGRCPMGKQCFAPRWSPNEDSFAYIVKTSRAGDPDAGIWVDDKKGHTRQIFRGWAVWYARGFGRQMYVLEGKGDLNGILWRIGWDGQGRARTVTIPLIHSYWNNIEIETQNYFDVSPDARHVAFEAQRMLQANIGMIENLQ